jgi:hypothetical protein
MSQESALKYLLTAKNPVTRWDGISFEAAGHTVLEAQTVKNLVRRGFVNRVATALSNGTKWRYTLTNEGRKFAKNLR